MSKYKEVFEVTVYQTVLIALNSHWDWYIRRLTEFIQFLSRKNAGSGHINGRCFLHISNVTSY